MKLGVVARTYQSFSSWDTTRFTRAVTSSIGIALILRTFAPSAARPRRRAGHAQLPAEPGERDWIEMERRRQVHSGVSVADGRGNPHHPNHDLVSLEHGDRGVEVRHHPIELLARREVERVLVTPGQLVGEVAQILPPFVFRKPGEVSCFWTAPGRVTVAAASAASARTRLFRIMVGPRFRREERRRR